MSWILNQKTAGVFSNNFLSSQACPAFGSSTPAGNIVLLPVWGLGFFPVAAGGLSATDSQGNIYSLLAFLSGTNNFNTWIAVFGSQITNPGILTCTVNSSPTSEFSVAAMDWSGGSLSLDNASVSTNASGVSSLALSLGITSPGSLLLGGVSVFFWRSTDSITSPSSLTKFYQQKEGVTHASGEIDYQIIPTPTTNLVTWSDATNTAYYTGLLIALLNSENIPTPPIGGGGGGSPGSISEDWNISYKHQWKLGITGDQRGFGDQLTPGYSSIPYRSR